MIAILTKIVPFLGPLLERFFPDKSKVAEIQAEKELVEAQAFKRGRISPKYLLGYVVVILFALFGIAILLHAFLPSVFTVSPVGELKEFIRVGQELL